MLAKSGFQPKNAKILLTGASRGLGPFIARALAAEGSDLGLVARSSEPLELLARELRAAGGRAVVLPTDLGRKDQRIRLASRVEAELGPVDVLVNNAAVEPVGPFAEEAEERTAETVELNVVAPMHLTRLVLPGMLERRRGWVVNIASAAGKKALPFSAVYGGTKAALIEWTSALRIELAGTGIFASAVCPGFVTGEGMFARHELLPPRTLGSSTPEQVAAAVVRILQTGDPEVIVNSLPIRLLLALYQLFPRLGVRVLDWLGVTTLQRQRVLVEARNAAEAATRAPKSTTVSLRP